MVNMQDGEESVILMLKFTFLFLCSLFAGTTT
jgi:hypothetical protein